jgi:hypothetical protein
MLLAMQPFSKHNKMPKEMLIKGRMPVISSERQRRVLPFKSITYVVDLIRGGIAVSFIYPGE